MKIIVVTCFKIANFMKLNKLILPAAIGTGLFIVLKKAKAGKNVADALKFNTEVFSFKVKSATPVITLKIQIINPSTSGTTVNSFSGTLYWQGKAVAEMDYLNKIVIKPKTVLNIMLPVKINTLESITALFVLITNKAKRLCKLHIDFYTPLGKFPYDKDILVGAPEQ